MIGSLPLRAADVAFIAVHCTGTPPSQDIGVKELDRMFRLNGFLSIGYHFVIRRDGTLEKGRRVRERGAHVEQFNHCSIGVCLVGGLNAQLQPEANYTKAQLKALRSLLEHLEDTFPRAAIQGHRDFPGVDTVSPSFDVKRWFLTNKVEGSSGHRSRARL